MCVCVCVRADCSCREPASPSSQVVPHLLLRGRSLATLHSTFTLSHSHTPPGAHEGNQLPGPGLCGVTHDPVLTVPHASSPKGVLGLGTQLWRFTRPVLQPLSQRINPVVRSNRCPKGLTRLIVIPSHCALLHCCCEELGDSPEKDYKNPESVGTIKPLSPRQNGGLN